MDRAKKIEELRATVAAHHGDIDRLRAKIKELNEQITEEAQQLEQDKRKAARAEAVERGRKWEAEDPEGHAAFLEKIRQRNRQAVLEGAEQGWWDVDDNGDMLAPPIIIDSAELPENALMAHVMAKAGIFPSISRARQNGWDKPLTKGLITVTKRKIRIKVI